MQQTIHQDERMETDAPALGPDPRLVATGGGEEDLAIVAAARAGRWRDGRYAKRQGDAFVWVGALDVRGEAHAVALKRVHTRGGLVGRLQTTRGRNRAQREWRGAALLRERGLRAARPIALLRRRPAEWTLLFERVEGRTALAMAREGDASERRTLASALGALVRTLEEKGVFNRDCKLSNLIVRADGAVVAIDCVGVRPTRITEDLRRRMLAAMLFEAHGADSMGARADRLRVLRASGERNWKQAWRDLERRLRAHGDTRPRTDPLA